MTDTVDAQTRSRMMAGIKRANTEPEMRIRRAIHQRGFRYRVHDRSLPGTPDLVFPGRKAVIQIQGCFWHMHQCRLFRWPATRPDFWRKKIEANSARDKRNLQLLNELGWRVLTIWECSLKGPCELPFNHLTENIVKWLLDSDGNLEISS